jgi:GT2 family glycosyltransferase
MTAQGLTSVIMVTYHTGNVLSLSIASVLAQTANVELVIVNNGNPPEIEEELIKKFKDDAAVRLMTGHGNIGLYKGYNLGARVARGDYLLFLSPRAVLTSDVVARMIEERRAYRNPALLGARLIDQKGEEVEGSRSELLSPANIVVETLRLGRFFPRRKLRLHRDPPPLRTAAIPCLSSAFMFLAAKDYAAMRGFGEEYVNHAGDADFCFRFRDKGGQIYFAGGLDVLVMDEPVLAPMPEQETERHKDLIRYFHNNYSDKYFQPLLWLLYLFLAASTWLRKKKVL